MLFLPAFLLCFFPLVSDQGFLECQPPAMMTKYILLQVVDVPILPNFSQCIRLWHCIFGVFFYNYTLLNVYLMQKKHIQMYIKY